MATIRQLLSEEQHRNAELSNQSQSGRSESQALQTKLKKLTDMYTAMRNEHLELLKQKQQFAQGRTQIANAKQAFEKLQRVLFLSSSTFSFDVAVAFNLLSLFISWPKGQGDRGQFIEKGDRAAESPTGRG